MIIIPPKNNRKWYQVNSSDIKGTLQKTRNIDFDQEGYAKLAKRARAIKAEDGAFTRISSIVYYDTRNEYIVMTQQGIGIVNGTTLAVTDGTLASNAPGVDSNGLSDVVTWQGRVYSNGPSGNGLRYYDSSGAWNTTGYTTTAVAGPLCVFEQKNYLAIGQASSVYLVNTSHVEQSNILSIGSDFRITSICNWNQYLVVGTRHINNGEAKVFLWDGSSAVANSGYSVGTYRIDSVKTYRDTFVAIVSTGQILKFNGGGFEELAAFPIWYKDEDWDLTGNFTSARVIHRGVVVDGDLIYINVGSRILLPSGDTKGKLFQNWFESGVWVYDPKVGLHHRYSHTSSLRSSETITTGNVNTSTNVITVASAPDTGTPVIYFDAGGTTIDGLVNTTKYYVIKLTGTTIKLATTKANADAGTAITLGSTGNSSQSLVYVPNRDFGGNSIDGNTSTTGTAGAIALIANRTNGYKVNSAKVIFGGKLGTTSTSETYFLCVCAHGQENRGFIQTPKLLSNAITDTWQNVSVSFRGIKTEEDKIIVKYRNIERPDNLGGIDQGLTQTATWVNSTSFTTTADLSDAKIGDEVSFHSGAGSGYMAHITSISETAGTYTIGIDETIQNISASNTVAFVIENWNKLGTITIDDVDYFTNDNGDRYISDGGIKTFQLNKPSKWVEIKLELRGEDVTIEDILVNNRPYKQFVV